VAPDHVAVHLGGLAGRVHGDVHEGLDHRRAQRPSRPDDREQLVDRRLRLDAGVAVALQGEDVAAQRQPAGETLLEDFEVRVVLAGEGQRFAVRLQVDDGTGAFRHAQPPSFDRTSSLTALPSARPATWGMS